MTKIVCWSIAKRHAAWRELLEMEADVALLQEAGKMPWDVEGKVDTGPRESWDSQAWNADYGDRWGKAGLYDRWRRIV